MESSKELILESKLEAERTKLTFTLDDILNAVQYGFDYRVESMNDGKSVPVGNVLQYLMWRKNLKTVPEEFKKYKQ